MKSSYKSLVVSFLPLFFQNCQSGHPPVLFETGNSNEGAENDVQPLVGPVKKMSAMQLIQHPDFAKEQFAGSPADMLAPNQHYSYPTEYKDFGRRFVPQYPYKEVPSEVNAEADLDNLVKMHSPTPKPLTPEEIKLIPIKAPPAAVLNIAMESVLYEANHPKKAKVDEKEMLRSGDYWNAYFVEDTDPKAELKSFLRKRTAQINNEKRKTSKGAVRAKIMPGSKLYQLVSVLKQVSPRLLYVINNKE